MGRSFILLLAALAASACSSSGGQIPSLAPRAAEVIDPRVPVERPLNDRPADTGLEARLAALVAQARGGEAAFASAAAEAERHSAGAGAAQSESWIAAQQALSVAVAARQPTALAQSDIDALAAEMLQVQGGLAPSDQSAIERAAAEVEAIARRQTERLDAIRQRLGG